MAKAKVLVVGLGKMGSMLAKRLATVPSRFETLVFNRTVETAKSFADKHGVKCVSNVAEGITEADFVLSVLTDSKAVKILVDQLIAEKVRANGCWIDCTSGVPEMTIETGQLIRSAMGMSFVDCAVSGGPRGAESGTLQSIVGGEDVDISHATEVINLFSKNVQHVGPVGAGHAVKAVNNTLLAAHMLLASEGLLALQKYGVDIRRSAAAIAGASGGSRVMAERVPNQMISRKFDYGFSMAGLAKDVEIGADLVSSAGIPDGFISLTRKNIRECLAELGPNADHTTVLQHIERQAGFELQEK